MVRASLPSIATSLRISVMTFKTLEHHYSNWNAKLWQGELSGRIGKNIDDELIHVDQNYNISIG